MRRWLGLGALVVMAACAWAAVSGCDPDGYDGWVSAEDVCEASHDVGDQPEYLRPTGGEISAPWLSPAQEQALLDAAEARVEATGGEVGWAVYVGGPDRVRVGDVGPVLLASCSPGDLPLADRHGYGAWTLTKPATGVAIVWDVVAPEAWAGAIADQLAVLEGRGSALPH